MNKLTVDENKQNNTLQNRARLSRARHRAVLTTGLVCMILLSFMAADLFKGDRVFSDTENRLLAQKPELSRESVLDGSFMEKYDSYVTDQFVGRDKWIGIKTRADIAMQRREVNGVYLGKDNYLIEQHLQADYPDELVERKLALLKNLAERWDAKVMLVPTADNILTDKLPAYAEYYDQRTLLDAVKEQVREERYIDVYGTLWEHRGEEIYYRTDHHWTSYGAYLGYQEWLASTGATRMIYKAETKTVSENFLGTLHSKINLPVIPDTIEYFLVTEMHPVQLTYDFQTKSDSFYEESYLETKNQYGFFMDDNHAFIEIDTGCHNGKTLFIIKDSYANCMIPLLSLHYEKIYVVDLRYMNGKLFPFMENYEPEDGMDVLVLYNCVHFLEEFNYW